MKFALKFLIILAFNSTLNICAQNNDKNRLARYFVNDTFITSTKYYYIKLTQSRDTTEEMFTPVFKNRIVQINDRLIIELDTVCLKSNLFNDAFSLYENSVKVLRNKKNILKINISLWQNGCSGSFCSDMVQVKIEIKKENIKIKVSDFSK